MSQQINLFNPIFLRQKKYFSALTMAQALGLIILGVLLMTGYSWYQTRTLSKQAVLTGARLTETQQQLTKVTAQYAPKKKDATLEEEFNRAQAEHAALQQAMQRLQNDEFGDRKGYSSYMRAFARQIVDGLWLTGFSIDGAGSAITIQGSALRPELVPSYMRRLGHEPVLQGKSFSVLEMQAPKEEQKKGADRLPADRINFDLRSTIAEKTTDKDSIKPPANEAKAGSETASVKAPSPLSAETPGAKKE